MTSRKGVYLEVEERSTTGGADNQEGGEGRAYDEEALDDHVQVPICV